MTKNDWLTTAEPQRLLAYLRRHPEQMLIGLNERTDCPAPLSDRKLRLWACACVRKVEYYLESEASVRAIATAERYADGESGLDTLAHAWADANSWEHQGSSPQRLLRQCARDCAGEHLTRHPWQHNPGWIAEIIAGIFPEQKATQADLLRCQFGNLFHPVAIGLCGHWGGAHRAAEDAARALARSIYTDRCFEDLPLLWDTLETAGCTCPRVRAHCCGTGRTAAVHARGCWVVDLVLGKE